MNQISNDVARIMAVALQCCVIVLIASQLLIGCHQTEKMVMPENRVVNYDDGFQFLKGPWLWMIAPVPEANTGGADSINVDSLSDASNGMVTEASIAARGASAGERVGEYIWTHHELRSDLESRFGGCCDNVGWVVNSIGWGSGDLESHTAYALLILESELTQNNVTMRVSSDDAIKVWLNSSIVWTNPVNRAAPRSIVATDYQDEFPVNLNSGANLLMVKVSEQYQDWDMFVMIEAAVNAVPIKQ